MTKISRQADQEEIKVLVKEVCQLLPELGQLVVDYTEQNRAIVWERKIHDLKEPNSPNKTKEVTSILVNQGAILRRGDIISLVGWGKTFNTFIFNGVNLIDLGDGETNLAIPKSLPVITEFPIDYWKDSVDSVVVWFDQQKMVDQLVANAECQTNDGTSEMISSFSYGKKVYRIVYDFWDVDDFRLTNGKIADNYLVEMLEIFKRQLRRDNSFYLETEFYDFRDDQLILLPDECASRSLRKMIDTDSDDGYD